MYNSLDDATSLKMILTFCETVVLPKPVRSANSRQLAAKIYSNLMMSDHIFGADSPLISSLSPDQTHSRRQLMTRLKRK